MAYANIIFICSGNTCRSQMAEAWVTANWPKQKVSSAGLRAKHGLPTTRNAQAVLAEYNIPWQGTSQLFDVSMVCKTDVLVAMTAEHYQCLQQALALPTHPQNKPTHILLPKLIRLDEARDIADPFGKDLAAYRDCFLQIERALFRSAAIFVE